MAPWGGRRWSNTRGPAVSDATEKESAAARELGQRPESAQAGYDARAEVTGRGEEVGYRAESEEKGNFLFLFPFQLFQSIFK
jgi:hypothetical protein